MSWTEVALGTWAPLTYGKALPEPTREPGQVPVYSSAGVTGSHSNALVESPAVIVGRKGNVGTVFYADTPSFPIDTAFYTQGSPDAHLKFVAYKLQSMRLGQHTRDSAVPGLRRDDYSALRTSVPPLPEQQAIAEVLGALDDKIGANAKLAVSTEQVAIATASQTVGEIQVGELAMLGKAQTQPSTLGEVPVRHYSLPAFDTDGMPALEPATTIKSSKFVVARQSVLVSKLNPRFPRIWHVGELDDTAVSLASTEFLVLEPAIVSTAVLWALLSNPSFSRSLESKVAGTSGSHQRVKPAEVLSESIGDPSTLAPALVTLINASVQQAAHARQESRTLATLRDALLPKLMSGRLRVKDAERTVEEVL